MNWNKLYNLIPSQIFIGETNYEVLWVDNFMDGETLGETRFFSKQIILKLHESKKESVSTFFHEWLHAMSNEYDGKLTESQVIMLEKGLQSVLNFGKLFNSRRNNETHKRERRNIKRIRKTGKKAGKAPHTKRSS